MKHLRAVLVAGNALVPFACGPEVSSVGRGGTRSKGWQKAQHPAIPRKQSRRTARHLRALPQLAEVN